MGKGTADVSRNMYAEEKRYQQLIYQQGKPWVAADDNDAQQINYNLLRRFLQLIIGNGAMGDGFKIVGTGADNDFTITGGDGTIEGAGRLLLAGFHCFLLTDRSYMGIDNIECTPVSTSLTDDVLTDSAANFTLREGVPDPPDDNLAGRTLVPDITQPDKLYTITANTQTTITVTGGMFADGITVGAHYRVELSTPLGSDRIDEVYLDCYLDEIASDEDIDIGHTLGIQIETQRRLKLIQNIFVAEGSTTPPYYIDADGNEHYTYKLATIQRYDSQDAINPGDITDTRTSIDQGIIDFAIEIMTARGSMDSLDARLDVFLNEDGTPKLYPTGTRMVFYQASVPPGWVQVTGINDRYLRCVDGAGGGTGGSWTISGLSADSAGGHSHATAGDHQHSAAGGHDHGAAGDHGHTTLNHTLTASQMPPHMHYNATLNEMGFDNYGVGYPSRVTFDDGAPWNGIVYSNATGYSGGGGAHNHGNTGSAGAHNHALISDHSHPAGGDHAHTAAGGHIHTITNDSRWRPSYADCIVGEYQG